MLLGEYRHNLDSKGRLAVPAKFRSKISEGAIVTKGLDKCLFVFGTEEWKSLVEKITALPLVQANSRAFARLMLAGAVDVNLDTQGRILIPDYLRNYASLNKRVVVAGLYSRVELWDSEEWDHYKLKTETASDEIAEKLGELGI